MAKAVFIQNPTSIYKDDPGKLYHFPKRYLNMVRETIGDFVVFYEGRNGAFGYTAIQKVLKVVPDKNLENHYFAILDQPSEWSFEQTVPRSDDTGIAFETSLRGPEGKPMSGGANVSAVRKLSETEFAAIFQYGMQALQGPDALPRHLDQTLEAQGFAEGQAGFDPAPLSQIRADVLMSRKYRDPSFARQVKAAYDGRCAISGLDLRNGGGRPEVEAAHIRPVAQYGPDKIINGLALSGTVHWMFDRGLISVSADYEILVSHNKVSPEIVARLIAPGRRLTLPKNPRHHPHPEYLRFHREKVFGQLG